MMVSRPVSVLFGSQCFISEDKMGSDFAFYEGKTMQKMEIRLILLKCNFSFDCQESRNLDTAYDHENFYNEHEWTWEGNIL